MSTNLNTVKNVGGCIWNIFTVDSAPAGFIEATDHNSTFRTERLALGWIKRQAHYNGGDATFAIVREDYKGNTFFSVMVGRGNIIL